MELKTNMKEEMIFTDSNGTEKAVLGTLEGPCADIIDGTRNNRHYTSSLWEKVFADGTVASELIENGGIPGEMDHPAERQDTDSSRIAILMKEKPKKKSDGKLWAKFQILNTPLGKIAYTLAKAGFNLGISSRGSGDTYIGTDGEEYVNEDTYDFQCFDLVLVPAVKDARLKLVTEGLDSSKKKLFESLDNIVKESSDEDKKIILETLDNLDIGYKPKMNEENLNLETSAEKSPEEQIDVSSNKSDAGNATGKLMSDLQEALKKNTKSQKQIMKLQEQLSVSNAEGNKLKEKLSAYRKLTESLSKSLASQKTSYEKKVRSLGESLKDNDVKLKQTETELQRATTKLSRERHIN